MIAYLIVCHLIFATTIKVTHSSLYFSYALKVFENDHFNELLPNELFLGPGKMLFFGTCGFIGV